MLKPPHFNTPGVLVQTTGGVLDFESLYDKVVRAGSYSSVKTPGFKLMSRRARVLQNNPFSWSFEEEIRNSGFTLYKQNDGRDRIKTGQIGHHQTSFLSYPVLDSTDADTLARNAVLKRLKSASINLGQAFAERKQTVNLISKSVNRIASAALAIRRGNFKHATNLFGVSGKGLKRDLPPSPNNLANHWLEYSYGWRPLVNDIYGAAEAIAKTYGDLPKITSVSAVGKAKVTVPSYHKGFGVEVSMLSKKEQTTRYTLFYTEDNTFSTAMGQTGISNPLLLAWELVPYSFVVDWFLPVGTYLSNLDASNGLFFRTGTVASRVKVSHISSLRPDSFYSGPGHSVGGGGVLFSSESKTRSPLSSFPSPSFPSPKFDLNLSQVLSGLALLTQVFKR